VNRIRNPAVITAQGDVGGQPELLPARGDEPEVFEVDTVRNGFRLETAALLLLEPATEPLAWADDPKVAGAAQVLEPLPLPLPHIGVGRKLAPVARQQRAAEAPGIAVAVPAGDVEGADRTRIVYVDTPHG
jgi:hypothetical protein